MITFSDVGGFVLNKQVLVVRALDADGSRQDDKLGLGAASKEINPSTPNINPINPKSTPSTQNINPLNPNQNQPKKSFRSNPSNHTTNIRFGLLAQVVFAHLRVAHVG